MTGQKKRPASTSSKVIIIGTGVIGLTSAYFLQEKGYDVHLFDHAAQTGLGASRYNGAQLSYSYIHPLGHPHIFFDILSYLTGFSSTAKIAHPMRDMSWLMKLLKESTPQNFMNNREEMLKLAFESQTAMQTFLGKHSIDFDYEQAGKLAIYHDHRAFESARDFMQLVNMKYGTALESLNTHQTLDRLPKAFNLKKIAGAIYSPIDALGDSYKFTQALQNILQIRGAKFYFNKTINHIVEKGDRILFMNTAGEFHEADIFVIAAGLGSAELLQQLLLSIPLIGIKGYICSMPNDYDLTFNLSDTQHKLVYAPLGNQIRIAGMADIGDDFPLRNPKRIEQFKQTINKSLPQADLSQITVESRIRPCLPSSVPLIGQHHFKNLYLNTGHGFLGWTLAMGSGQRLADLISTDALKN